MLFTYSELSLLEHKGFGNIWQRCDINPSFQKQQKYIILIIVFNS